MQIRSLSVLSKFATVFSFGFFLPVWFLQLRGNESVSPVARYRNLGTRIGIIENGVHENNAAILNPQFEASSNINSVGGTTTGVNVTATSHVASIAKTSTAIKDTSAESTLLSERKKKDMGDILWFHADSPEAISLYKGCTPVSYSWQPDLKPTFLIIGVQKSGTTSVKGALRKYVCAGSGGEAHFFDDPALSRNPPTAAQLQTYEQRWQICPERHDGELRGRYEKTPSYYYQLWAPLRACEALGGEQQKVVLFLRDPVQRALSSFFESRTKRLKATTEDFDRLVNLDIDIFEKCGGVPKSPGLAEKYANISQQKKNSISFENFETCCSDVAISHGLKNWPGCGFCDKEETANGRFPFRCGAYGSKVAAHVRMGLYVFFVQNWLRYFKAHNMRIYIVEESLFRGDMPRVVYELSCSMADEKNGQKNALACDSAKSKKSLGEDRHANTRDHPTMWESTRKKLTDFYEPFNRDLERLIGRNLPW